MPEYGEFEYGEELYGDGGTPPDVVPPGRVSWKFYDGATTYNLPVNPNAASTPKRKRTLTYQATAAGNQIKYEGRSSPNIINFSGDILNEAQFRSFQVWTRKRKQVRITDDLGQNFWVYFKSFSPSRQKAQEYNWMMSYSVEAFVLDRGSV